MLLQALALLVVVGIMVPGYLDYVFRPLSCTPGQWCMDLRGLAFQISALFLGPPALLLLATYWLWRRPRRWPAALPILADVAVIGVVFIDLVAFAQTRSADPNIVVQLLLGLVPALVSLTLVLALVGRWDSRKGTPRALSDILRNW